MNQIGKTVYCTSSAHLVHSQILTN